MELGGVCVHVLFPFSFCNNTFLAFLEFHQVKSSARAETTVEQECRQGLERIIRSLDIYFICIHELHFKCFCF